MLFLVYRKKKKNQITDKKVNVSNFRRVRSEGEPNNQNPLS